MAASRLHPRFGLEIRSRDVRQSSAADIDEIRDLLRQFGVLLFRDQVLTDEDLYRFSTAIGDGRMGESADRIALSAANAAISNLTNLHDDQQRPLGFGRNDTDYWHSDQEYRQSPATLASLYCLIPAERGGITSFATTRVAALNMAGEVLERLRELKSTRRPARTHDNVDHIEVAHPVVLRDPIDGSEQLYVSELLVRFPGVTDDEGRALKQAILDRVLHEENIYHHEWRMGDLLLFDNAQLTHRREAFEGIRWLKATKIFAPRGKFAVPEGEIVSEAATVSARAGTGAGARTAAANAGASAGAAMEARTRSLIAETFQVYATGLARPTPVLIRAGKAGGLAFDSLTTDVVVGCLPSSHVCYGSCFAARESYRLGVDFGVRVENTLDEPLFRADLAKLPPRQRYLRNGWHSDPSWRWDLAACIATVIHDERKHTVFVTKLFRAIPPEVLPRLIAARAELRISVSALDPDAQLRHRLEAAVAIATPAASPFPWW
jgi:taurine dioxygenase